jgi:hypothetical protein
VNVPAKTIPFIQKLKTMNYYLSFLHRETVVSRERQEMLWHYMGRCAMIKNTGIMSALNGFGFQVFILWDWWFLD